MKITINTTTFNVDDQFLNQPIDSQLKEKEKYKKQTIRFQRAIEIKDNLDIENEGSSRKVVFDILLGKHKPENIPQMLLVNLNMIHNHINNNLKINIENLRTLYDLMWLNIHDKNKLSRAEYPWRTGPGIIHSKKQIFHTLEPKYLNEAMDNLFIYIQDNDDSNYANSALLIMFLFVYIHPFYDYNGKTSRVLATWYLSNHADYLSSLFLSFIFKVKREEFFNDLGELRKTIESYNDQNHDYDLTPLLKKWSKWLDVTKKAFIKIFNHYSLNGYKLLDNHISTFCFIALSSFEREKKWFSANEIEEILNFQSSKQTFHHMINKMIDYGVLQKKKPSKHIMYAIKI